MTRHRVFVAILSAVFVASPTLADGLFTDVFRGLGYLATPSGGPLIPTADGTRVNGQRSGRLRIVPERFGQGYNLELDRSFGNDSRGRPEVLDLGPLELQLSGATQTTASFTKRGFLVGNFNSNINNLAYSIRAKTGAQDAALTGTLNGATNVEVNQFGFYTINMNLNNAGSQITLDGVVDNSNPTSFDLGPIAIQGNIFFDGFVALLGSVGVDTTQLQQLAPDSPIDRIVGAIQDQAQQNGLVAGVTFDRASLVLGADGTSADLANALALPARGDFIGGSNNAGAEFTAGQREGLTVPEPSAWVLIAIGLAAYVARRRR